MTVLYLLVELFFLKIGIYEHHWWKYYMTAFVIFFYQVISKMWFKKMNQLRHGLMRMSTLYFVGFVLLHYPIPILLLFKETIL